MSKNKKKIKKRVNQLLCVAGKHPNEAALGGLSFGSPHDSSQTWSTNSCSTSSPEIEHENKQRSHQNELFLQQDTSHEEDTEVDVLSTPIPLERVVETAVLQGFVKQRTFQQMMEPAKSSDSSDSPTSVIQMQQEEMILPTKPAFQGAKQKSEPLIQTREPSFRGANATIVPREQSFQALQATTEALKEESFTAVQATETATIPREQSFQTIHEKFGSSSFQKHPSLHNFGEEKKPNSNSSNNMVQLEGLLKDEEGTEIMLTSSTLLPKRRFPKFKLKKKKKDKSRHDYSFTTLVMPIADSDEDRYATDVEDEEEEVIDEVESIRRSPPVDMNMDRYATLESDDDESMSARSEFRSNDEAQILRPGSSFRGDDNSFFGRTRGERDWYSKDQVQHKGGESTFVATDHGVPRASIEEKIESYHKLLQRMQAKREMSKQQDVDDYLDDWGYPKHGQERGTGPVYDLKPDEVINLARGNDRSPFDPCGA